MAYADVSWAYKDPITLAKMTQMSENSVWTSEHRVIGCEIEVTGNETVEVHGGRIEIAGNWLWRDSNDGTTGLFLTAADANDWYSASGGEATITGWHIVAYNDSGNSFQCRFRVSGPAYSDTASGTAIGPKRYDKTGTTWLRYIGYVVNNTAGNLVGQHQRGDRIMYDNPNNIGMLQIINNTGTSTMTTKVLAPLVPKISTLCSIQWQPSGAATTFFARPTDSTSSGYGSYAASDDWEILADIPTNSSQSIDWRSRNISVSAWIKDYTMDIR